MSDIQMVADIGRGLSKFNFLYTDDTVELAVLL
jgi:hypothetical protein